MKWDTSSISSPGRQDETSVHWPTLCQQQNSIRKTHEDFIQVQAEKYITVSVTQANYSQSIIDDVFLFGSIHEDNSTMFQV